MTVNFTSTHPNNQTTRQPNNQTTNMACILHIETSTDVCSVAVSKDGFLLYEKEDHSGPNHAERLGTYVDEALAKVEEKGQKLEAVAVSSGPGSYTGLRIGVSMAKGVCYGSDAKLLSVPTLQLLCVPVLLGDGIRCYKYSGGEAEKAEEQMEDGDLLCPMIDARRMEVYAAIYDRSLKEVRGQQADIVDAETYKELLDKHKVFFFGNGAEKCMEVINHPNARLVKGIEPLAKNMLPLADMKWNKGQTEDVAYFVPEYVKDYVAKKSVSKLLTPNK